MVSLQFITPRSARSDAWDWEALLRLVAPQVIAYNSLHVGDSRARRGEGSDGSPLDGRRWFDGPKGNLRIFYGGSSHIGVVLAMLRAARAARSRGIDLVLGPMPVQRAPQRQLRRIHELVALFECLPPAPPIDSESEIDFDVAAALRRHPAIIATGRPVSAGVNDNAGNAVLDRWYLRIEQLLGAGIDVWAAIYNNIRPGRPSRIAAG